MSDSQSFIQFQRAKNISVQYSIDLMTSFRRRRGVKIISLKMGEDPTGFLAKRQALPRRDRTAEQIALEIDALLTAHPQTANKLAASKTTLGLIPSATTTTSRSENRQTAIIAGRCAELRAEHRLALARRRGYVVIEARMLSRLRELDQRILSVIPSWH